MKRYFIIPMLFLATAAFAGAQITAPATDVLGAHLNYGRGCAACHAPHSGAQGNGALKTSDPSTGNSILWGQDVASLYGATIKTGGVARNGAISSYSETLPTSMSAVTPDVNDLITCLSCHDGNLAKGAMMKGIIYESLPATYGTFNKPPTLLGNDGTGAGNYLNDHPVGLAAKFGCNSTTGGVYTESGYNWDCVLTTGVVSGTTTTYLIQAGPNMSNFIQNYGFFVALDNNAGTPVVNCTTCHNQHLMNVVSVANDGGAIGQGGTVSHGVSGLAPGNYATMFFIRGPYNPASGTAGSNQTAQFCRQCHGGESNEMNGGTAGTTF